MANAREISTRIKSIHDTMKITKAMYMMSSMKLRKARQKLENTEPYFYGLQEQIADILLHFPDMKHLYFDNRGKDLHETSKRRAFIVITGDKGMAGAYNHNVLKEAQKMVCLLYTSVTPINILEVFTRPLSLCMRLFGNVLGAFVIMELIKMVVPVVLPAVFSLYFDCLLYTSRCV